MVILISNNIDFRTKNVIKDKEIHLIIIKESFHKEDVIILNTYMHNNRASKYKKLKLTKLKGGIDKSTIVVVYFIYF